MRRKTSVTFHGGVNEIGGNKILLKDGDISVLLDYGLSFRLRSQYYSAPFLSPRSEKELLELGILPDLEGVYRFDPVKPKVDAVILSHSHMDHAAYVSFVKEEIPVYCGSTTATILDAYSEIRPSGFEFNLEGLNFRTFRTGDKIELGSLQVEPIHVDHSVPGSYGFVIQTSTGALVYTGDFRMHGDKPNLTEDFLETAANAEPVVAITENTNMTHAEVSSEEEVRAKLSEIVRSTTGLVLANFACADIDRLRSFYETAVENGRRLVVTLRQAYLLSKLSGDPHLDVPRIEDENLLVFQKAKDKYYLWEREAMNLGETVNSQEIAKEQGKVIFACSSYDLGELTEIKPSPGSCYVLSASEPFNEETEIDFERLLNWLEHYGLPQYHVHVSGHITPLRLRESLRKTKPKTIFPIHGTSPVLFSKFMADLDSRIILPQVGRSYEVA